MLEFARLPFDERILYFQEVASRRGLTRLIVEKDFWVCFSLRILFSTPAISDKFVFKGGTSLSKVFGIIKRFSEDIDLSVDPTWLGFGGENRPDAARSHSQFEKRWKRLNDACAALVDQKIRPALEQAIQAALGPPHDGPHYLAFNLDKQTQSPEGGVLQHELARGHHDEHRDDDKRYHFPAMFRRRQARKADKWQLIFARSRRRPTFRSPRFHEDFLASHGISVAGAVRPGLLRVLRASAQQDLDPRKPAESPQDLDQSLGRRSGRRRAYEGTIRHVPEAESFRPRGDKFSWGGGPTGADGEAERRPGLQRGIILKDISTVGHEPARLWEWARIARETIEAVT